MSIDIVVEYIRSRYRSVAIAFSGGFDSTLLLYAAVKALGRERVVAITVDAPHISRRDVERCRAIARELGVQHIVLELPHILELEDVRKNTANRCYLCKKAMYRAIAAKARELGLEAVLDGTNADDFSSDRPGLRALKELNIDTPLARCGIGRKDVEKLVLCYGYPLSMARRTTCLLTRFPPNREVRLDDLKRVERAESILIECLGYEPKVLRVRDHGDLARIEVDREDMVKLLEILVPRSRCLEELKKLGYRYITLDCEGYHGW